MSAPLSADLAQIGKSVVIKGELSGSEDLYVDGQVEGSISLKNNSLTVGPNGTDISTDDGKNWHALQPEAALHEAADADRNWNALSLPFVVGPHGRIGKLDEAALKH